MLKRKAMRNFFVLFLILIFCSLGLGSEKVVFIDSDMMNDAALSEGNPTYNYGGLVYFYIGFASSDVALHCLIAPVLDTIPVGSTIDSAFFQSYQYDVDDNGQAVNAKVFGVTESWVEGTKNGVYEYGSSSWNNRGHGTSVCGDNIDVGDSIWTTAGGTISASASDSIDGFGTAGVWHKWDITDIIDSMMTDAYFGFVLKDEVQDSSGQNEYTRGRSTDYTDTVPADYYRPRVIVYYTPPAYTQASVSVTIPDGWLYGRAIKITNENAGTLTNHQIKIELDSDVFNFDRTETYGQDIRFFASDKTTAIDFKIVSWSSTAAEIWVELPSIPTGDSYVYMIYGYATSNAADLKVGWLTDIHFGADLGSKYGTKALEFVSEFKDWMNDEFVPNVVVVTGDYVNDINAADDSARVDTIRQSLDSLDVTHWHCMGNHEDKMTAAQWKGALNITYTDTFVNLISGYDAILLSTKFTTSDAGSLSSAQFDSLYDWLQRGTSKKLVFLHQPPDTQAYTLSRYWDDSGTPLLDYASLVRDTLEAGGNVAGVFSGHIHWDNHSAIENIPYFSLNSLVEDTSEEHGEITIYGDRYLTIVYRARDEWKNTVIWDMRENEWIGEGSDVFLLWADFDGDDGHWLETPVRAIADQEWKIVGNGYLREITATGAHNLVQSDWEEQTNYVAEVDIRWITPVGTGASRSGFAYNIEDSLNFDVLYSAKTSTAADVDLKHKYFDETWQDRGPEFELWDDFNLDEAWHTIKLVKQDNEYCFYADEEIVFCDTLGTFADSGLGFWNYGYGGNLNNFRVREYAASEPSIEIMAERPAKEIRIWGGKPWGGNSWGGAAWDGQPWQ